MTAEKKIWAKFVRAGIVENAERKTVSVFEPETVCQLGESSFQFWAAQGIAVEATADEADAARKPAARKAETVKEAPDADAATAAAAGAADVGAESPTGNGGKRKG